jgi:V-type H+-transporting ATPase S1 subunit
MKSLLLQVTLRFRFPTAGSAWSLTSVEVEKDANKFELNVVGKPPSAPFGFSFKCSRTLKFHANGTTLTLSDIQVQPGLNGKTRFGDAFNCVGFTTAPIWAGVFVTSILLLILSLGIGAIMNIKTPNRFENRSGKQLTFTIQE